MSSSAEARRHHGRATPRWSQEEMLAELRASAGRHGKLRTVTFRRDYESGLTGLDLRSVYLRFGSWIAAVRAAGYTPGEPRTGGYKRMSEADCVAAVAEVAALLGEMPSIGDYDAVRTVEPERGLPCNAIIRQHCGSWTRALELAELSVQLPKGGGAHHGDR